MSKKPVPCVRYKDLYFVIDHHHTLVSVELSGFDPEIVLEIVHNYVDGENSTPAAFWSFMEAKGALPCPRRSL